MLVTMLTSTYAVQGNLEVGDDVEVSDELGNVWRKAGIARLASDVPAPPEKAPEPEAEQLTCKVPGCTSKPFATASALKGHNTRAHSKK